MMMFDDTKRLNQKRQKCTAVFNIHFHLLVA